MPDIESQIYEFPQLKRSKALALNNLAVRLYEQEKYDASSEACEEAIRLDPNFAFSHATSGLLLHKSGKYEESIVAYKKSINLDPNLAIVRSNLALVLKEVGRIREAIDNVEAAIRLDPNMAEAHKNLGTILLSANPPQIEKAKRAFHRYAELRPNDEMAAMIDLLANTMTTSETETEHTKKKPSRPRSSSFKPSGKIPKN